MNTIDYFWKLPQEVSNQNSYYRFDIFMATQSQYSLFGDFQ